MKVAALIPAKATSERCPGKNTRPLGGKPLFVWSILQAQACPSISEIILSTDLAPSYLTDVMPDGPWRLHARNPDHAGPLSPDIDWISDLLPHTDAEVFVLLRPTSPFRTPQTIEAALAHFIESGADSLRACRKVKDHPAKCWKVIAEGGYIAPIVAVQGLGESWSLPYQALPEIFIQDSSLEIAHRATYEAGSLTGARVLGWEQPGHEGFAIDTERDWQEAERLAKEGVLTGCFTEASEAP